MTFFSLSVMITLFTNYICDTAVGRIDDDPQGLIAHSIVCLGNPVRDESSPFQIHTSEHPEPNHERSSAGGHRVPQATAGQGSEFNRWMRWA